MGLCRHNCIVNPGASLLVIRKIEDSGAIYRREREDLERHGHYLQMISG
jgi:hypothetical protein